ncbi:MAG TPA: polyprenyl synthetase family protein, partial [Roseiflexaceae bacterium]|nr:polyprenyl synthetase family protein [Roseiflexaceae bacterium]
MLQNADVRQAVQTAMRQAYPVAEGRVANLYGMQQYHLGWRDRHFAETSSDPGKLLRPRLALLVCQAVGGNAEQALPLAAGIQLFHDYTLLHDDIQDVSEMRRGRSTVWNEWGVAHAITAGDSMAALAHLALHRLAAEGIPVDRVLTVLQWFDEAVLAVCEGQYLDCDFEGDLAVTEDDYLSMVRRKTATLIGAAAGLGALVGGADSDTVQAWNTVGINLGMAFQIQDDLIGIWGDSHTTGKPGSGDLQRRKVTLPIIRALCHPEFGPALGRIYSQETIT